MSLNKKEIETLKFHVETQDYLGNLATILDLMRQERELLGKKHEEIITKLVSELVFIDENYKISEK